MTVPLGRAIRWTEEEIDAFLDISEDDVRAARALWQKYAKRPGLIDAKLQDDTINAFTATGEQTNTGI